MMIIVALGLFATCHVTAAVGPLVKIPLGTLEGWEGLSRNGRKYEAWTKVPYAQPPLGPRRLSPPRKPLSWEGVLQATNMTPACLQRDMGPPGLSAATWASEDCLYLDIYRPKDMTLDKLPVLVYIHGGAFSIGNVGGKHSAAYLMDEDVILVQVSYRLNGFGFMSLGDNTMPGNYGQKDQVQALKWLNRYIKFFGGNSKSMTVFGESSGGASSHLLLKSPLSEKLVARAVSHSGAINHVSTMLKTDFVKNNTLTVAVKVGCTGPGSRKIKKCLQAVDAEKLMDAIAEVSEDPIQLSFAPVIEPKTVKNPFATEDLAIRSTSKPWINTFTNGEYQLYVMMLTTSPNYVRNAARNLEAYLENWLRMHIRDRSKLRKAVQVLKKMYFSAKMPYALFLEQLAKMHADNNFVYPALFNANNHEGPTWLAQLEYSSSVSMMSPQLGIAGHAAHSHFYFNRAGRAGVLSPYFVSVSKRLIKYLVNFAKFDNPTPPGSDLIWPEFNSTETLRVQGGRDVIGNDNFYKMLKKKYDFWFSLIAWS